MAWGLRQQDRILQYPFLVGLVSLCYLFHQAIGLSLGRNEIPRDALVASLVMLTLCCAASYAGYISWRPTEVRSFRVYSANRLLLAGAFFIAVGWYGYYKLTSLTGGLTSFLTIHGSYSYVWEGTPVKYNSFKEFFLPGVVLVLASTMMPLCSLLPVLFWCGRAGGPLPVSLSRPLCAG